MPPPLPTPGTTDATMTMTGARDAPGMFFLSFFVFFAVLIIIYSYATCWGTTTTMPPPLLPQQRQGLEMRLEPLVCFLYSFLFITLLMIIYT